MRILYVTTIGTTMGFFKSFVSGLLNDGHTVDIACNQVGSPIPAFYTELGCKAFDLSCSRSPFNKGNIRAIGEIKRILSENHYDIIHCHTPIAAAITRIAARKAGKNGTKVIYTAHGFHFYKGAPLKNWLIYYPVEKLCAHFTDILITINKEDYALAKRKLKAKQIEYVPGVGIDTERFSECVINKAEKRKDLGIPEDAMLLLSVGELNKNKNHENVIRAISTLNNKKIHYAIAGIGLLKDYLVQLSEELNVKEQIHILGFRTDVEELYKSADVYLLPSFREGLNVSVMEAMASRLPIIASDIRGNCDMVKCNGGILISPFNVSEISNAITEMYDDENRNSMANFNAERAKDKYDYIKINAEMLNIYKNSLNGDMKWQ